MPDDEQNVVEKTSILGITEGFIAPRVKLPSHYAIIGIIGQGGMGVVYKANDLRLNREVAIKVLYIGTSDGSLEERLVREAKALASLDHPNIVKFLGWGLEDPQQPYFVMEFLEGKPLSDEIGAEKRLDPSSFFSVFSQVLAGLDHLHNQKIIHRDLKPSNIILCRESDSVKLIDFGIARFQDGAQSSPGSATLTKTGTLIGSPSYMSPEQCRGAKVDHLSDIYSVACIMHEALTGKPPHVGETPMEIMYKHMTVTAESLEPMAGDVGSKKLAHIVDRCLQKDPALRPQSAREILIELESIFATKLETSKFFRNRQLNAKSKKSRLFKECVFAALVILIVLVFSQLYLRLNQSHQVDDVLARDKKVLLGRIADKQRIILNLERGFPGMEAGTARTAAAITLVSRLVELAHLYEQNNDYKTAEKVLEKAFHAIALVDPASVRFCKSKVFLEFGLCKLAVGDNQAAEDYFDKGLKEKSFDSTNRARLSAEHAILKIKKHDFAEANIDLQSLVAASGASNAWAASLRQTGLATSSSAMISIRRIAKSLSSETIVKPDEQLTALRLYYDLAMFSYSQHSTELKDDVVKHMKQLLQQLPGTDDKTKEIKVSCYKLLSEIDPK